MNYPLTHGSPAVPTYRAHFSIYLVSSRNGNNNPEFFDSRCIFHCSMLRSVCFCSYLWCDAAIVGLVLLSFDVKSLL